MLASLRSRQMPARRVLAALVVALQYARGEWTGILGLNFESDGNKVDQRAMQCPSGFITGVTVRHGRDDDDDTDMYDFKLRCGDRWSAWSGMPFKSLKEEKSAECPMKMHVTGLEVKQVSTRHARGTHRAVTNSARTWPSLRPATAPPVARREASLHCAVRRGGASSETWTRTTSSCSARACGRSTWTSPSQERRPRAPRSARQVRWPSAGARTGASSSAATATVTSSSSTARRAQRWPALSARCPTCRRSASRRTSSSGRSTTWRPGSARWAWVSTARRSR